MDSTPIANMPSSFFDAAEIEKTLVQKNLRKRIISAVLRHLYQCETPSRAHEEEVFELKKELLAERQSQFLECVSTSNSEVDQSSKLLFKTRDGHLIESVILRSYRKEKNSVCISTQVGCTEKCNFCATGSLAFKRNLSLDEICEQVLQMRQILKAEGRQLTHIVYMGMGEPLRNAENVCRSLDLFTNMRYFKISPQAITVSTLGIPKGMLQLAHEHPQVHMALSLHAPEDGLRTEVMPINKKHNIAELLDTLKTIQSIHHYPFMISYILFKGLNDQLEHAQALRDLFDEAWDKRRIIFNLIPFNEIPESRFKRTSEEDMQPFKNVLIQAGYPVTVRRSFGPDIDAACGQLAAKQPLSN